MIPALLAIVALAIGLAVWIGRHRQRRRLAARVDRLVRAADSRDSVDPGVDALGSVPPPVARYLHWALPQNRRIRLVRMTQTGTLRTDVSTERWMRFEAEHLVAPAETAFLWNARVTVGPMVHLRVLDALIGGQGSGQVSLLSAFTLSQDAGTPEMNSGSLHRFLAEAVWYPTALLPSQKLRWTPIDAGRALATLTDRGASVSLEFLFAETGEVTTIYTPGRWGRFGGGYRQEPWEGHFRGYRRTNGIHAPSQGEVGWHVDARWRPVWKGKITELKYETDQAVFDGGPG